MKELFRLAIDKDRSVFIPQRLLNILAVGYGDELWIEVVDGRVISFEGHEGTLPPLTVAEIQERNKRIEEIKNQSPEQIERNERRLKDLLKEQ